VLITVRPTQRAGAHRLITAPPTRFTAEQLAPHGAQWVTLHTQVPCLAHGHVTSGSQKPDNSQR